MAKNKTLGFLGLGLEQWTKLTNIFTSVGMLGVGGYSAITMAQAQSGYYNNQSALANDMQNYQKMVNERTYSSTKEKEEYTEKVNTALRRASQGYATEDDIALLMSLGLYNITKTTDTDTATVEINSQEQIKQLMQSLGISTNTYLPYVLGGVGIIAIIYLIKRRSIKK